MMSENIHFDFALFLRRYGLGAATIAIGLQGWIYFLGPWSDDFPHKSVTVGAHYLHFFPYYAI
jgi:hypothetical protein